MRASAFGAAPPRFAAEIDIDEHVRALPSGASAKGMFLRDPLRRVAAVDPRLDLFERAKVPRRRLLPFFDYPYAEFMRLLVAAAEVLYPDQPRGEGLRRLGRGGYEALLDHQVGKVIFAAFGSDFSRVAAVGARGWQVSVSFGRFEYQHLADGHGAYHFREFPAFIETYQVGVIEGAMRVCGVEGEVLARVEGLSEGTLEMFWG